MRKGGWGRTYRMAVFKQWACFYWGSLKYSAKKKIKIKQMWQTFEIPES